MGLIMGGPLLRKDLDSAVDTVSATARRDARVSELQATAVASFLSDRQLDQAEVRFVFLIFFYLLFMFTEL